MRKSSIGRATQDEEAQIDLTPMLDVVFIMLIFFIVTATFVKETGIDVNRPEASEAESKDNASILIAINANNEIWADKRQLDVRAVKAFVERMRAESPEAQVVVQADFAADVETLVNVVDAAREAGALDVSVSTDDK